MLIIAMYILSQNSISVILKHDNSPLKSSSPSTLGMLLGMHQYLISASSSASCSTKYTIPLQTIEILPNPHSITSLNPSQASGNQKRLNIEHRAVICGLGFRDKGVTYGLALRLNEKKCPRGQCRIKYAFKYSNDHWSYTQYLGIFHKLVVIEILGLNVKPNTKA
ncbi:hypothetical protein JTB14_021941 [Gonioctena quinquepunctata]|nr:hypothetical protein JTB14_021941 [Gonioctena quinquepunctata]